MMRLPRRGDVWTAGSLRARVVGIHAGKAPCWPAGTPAGWITAHLENPDGFCGLEILPIAEFVVRYELEDGGADTVN